MHNPETPSATATAARPAPAADERTLDSSVGSDGLLTPASTAEDIPDKLYFRIGDVARLAGIKPYVLRFWETEFPSLGPKKSGTGHRLYRRKDVQLVFEIKALLYEKRFTIEGARKHLEARAKVEPAAAVSSKRGKGAEKKPAKLQAGLFDVPHAALDTVRQELADILQLLK